MKREGVVIITALSFFVLFGLLSDCHLWREDGL